MDDREGLILLNRVPDLGPRRLKRLLEAFDSPAAICAAEGRQLRQVEGIPGKLAEAIYSACRSREWLDAELAAAARAGAGIVTLTDAAYPPQLKNIYDPPPVLYVRGRVDALAAEGVAVVGTRRASAYGLHVAERLGYDLALRGLVVFSGLARGIDAAAHRGALRAGGRTVGLLGNGLSSVYPPEHAKLADQMQLGGAVASEYPMAMPPLAHHFPRRNRLISGLSLGVVIVEAGNRSGAIVTADCALEQGREVLAVPGPMDAVFSQGCHQLLKQGATLVTGVDDILETIERLRPARRVEAPAVELSNSEQRLLACFEQESPADIDSLSEFSGLACAEVAAGLIRLELKGLIQRLPGAQFVRNAGIR